MASSGGWMESQAGAGAAVVLLYREWGNCPPPSDQPLLLLHKYLPRPVASEHTGPWAHVGWPSHRGYDTVHMYN